MSRIISRKQVSQPFRNGSRNRPTRQTLGRRARNTSQTIPRDPHNISNEDAKDILQHFAKLPDDYFINGKDGKEATKEDIQLFFDLANHTKALKPQGFNYGYVYDVEAFYYDKVTDEAEIYQLINSLSVSSWQP